MCRWLAYIGAPVLVHDALYTPAHSLIDQSLRTLRERYPERAILRALPDDARIVLSEPVGDLPGARHEATPPKAREIVGRITSSRS